jgi:hypothetical protein
MSGCNASTLNRIKVFAPSMLFGDVKQSLITRGLEVKNA